MKIEEDAGTDYRLRVTCSERTPTDFIGAAVDDLDYDNFENRVASTRGWGWHDTLLESGG